MSTWWVSASCTVTARQAVRDLPRLQAVTHVLRRRGPGPDHQTTTPDQTKVYGADDPAYTATFDGLVNGDTEARPSPAWSSPGHRAGAGVGDYDITPSGATNPNYDIDYVTGTETITPGAT